MNKVKILLTLLTIAITVGPLIYVVLIYQDNLPGLVMPPQIQNLTNGDTSGVLSSQITPPTAAGNAQYNPDTGAFSYPINFTNPLTTQISIDQVSAQLKSKDDNALLGSINMDQPINIAPGQSAIINATGNISQDTLNQLNAQYQAGTLNLNNLELENVNVVVGGVTLHLDQVDLGSIQSTLTGGS